MSQLGGEEVARTKNQRNFVVFTKNEAGESSRMPIDADFSSLSAHSMDDEKLALEERLADPSTTPDIQALSNDDIEFFSSSVVPSYAETIFFHSADNCGTSADLKQSFNSALEEVSSSCAKPESVTLAREEDMLAVTHRPPSSAELKERENYETKEASMATAVSHVANFAPAEVPAVTNKNCISSSLAKPEESLKLVLEGVVPVARDKGRPSAPDKLKESLSLEPKELSMVADGSSNLEEMPKFAMREKSLVDSVTDNLVKVFIQHATNVNGEHMPKQCGNSLENGEGSYLESQEGCHSVGSTEKRAASAAKVSLDREPTQKNAGVGGMQVESDKDNKLLFSMKELSRPGSSKVFTGDEDDSDKDEDGIAMEEDGVLDEGVEQESEDSDSSSSTSTLCFSSSSDDEEAARFPNNLNQELEMEAESECEEGELKESPSQRKKIIVKKKALAESSEDETPLKEPVRSRNEMKNMPPVPKVSVTLQPFHTTIPAGFVSSVVGASLIVEGIEGQQPLSEGSILWLTEQRSPLGIVDELFGPVKKPFYVVRYNDASELPEEVKEGAQVSYVRDFAEFVLNNPDLYAKGYDNTGDIAEELSDSEVYFSDDEKEAEYRRSKVQMKRGSSELRTPDIDTSQQQGRRSQGKRANKDSRNQRSSGDHARSSWSNSDFSGRPPRHQNSSFQHCQGERDQSFQRRKGDIEPPYQHRQGESKPHARAESRQKPNDRKFENQSSGRQAGSQQSLSVSRHTSSAPPRHAVSVSDEVGDVPQQQEHAPKKDKLQASSRPISQEVQPTQSNQSSQSMSWESQLQQSAQSRSCMLPASPQQMSQSSDFMQATSYKSQMHQPYNVMPSTSPQEQTNPPYSFQQSTPQMNQPHSFMQPVLHQGVPLQSQNHLQSTPQQGQMLNQSPVPPQSQTWHMNQSSVPSFIASPQLPGVEHSQIPACNAALVVGQVSQVAGSGYGLPTTNNVPIQSGVCMGQGVLPMHQPPIFQQGPLQKQISSFGQHQFVAQGSPNMAIQMGNQVQAHVDGYGMGVQPAAGFSAPVLGIPVGSAANYIVQNQHYSGFTPGCAPPHGNGQPVMYGVPEHPSPMQPTMQPPTGTSPASWQQQNPPQVGPWQKPYQQRPPHGRSPYRSPRF